LSNNPAGSLFKSFSSKSFTSIILESFDKSNSLAYGGKSYDVDVITKLGPLPLFLCFLTNVLLSYAASIKLLPDSFGYLEVLGLCSGVYGAF